jgi:hypothetical protein
MAYRIKPYTYRRARALGVTVKPSTRKGKKIDVFKNGKKVASVGALGYGDYPTFTIQKGKAFADKRRRAYKQRHQKDRMRRGTPGFYADQLLW